MSDLYPAQTFETGTLLRHFSYRALRCMGGREGRNDDLFEDPVVDKIDRDKLRISMRGSVDLARRRQEKRLRLGEPAA